MSYPPGTYNLVYGTRPGFAPSYRICDRCLERDGSRVKGALYVIHPRRWWQLLRKTETICDACAVSSLTPEKS